MVRFCGANCAEALEPRPNLARRSAIAALIFALCASYPISAIASKSLSVPVCLGMPTVPPSLSDFPSRFEQPIVSLPLYH
jgi:hypothetical protein